MAEQPNTIHTLLGDALRETTDLARKEFKLFRTEISENLKAMFLGLGFIIGAAIFAIGSLIWLTQALVHWLATIVKSEALAALIVGVALLVVAVVLGLIGRSRMSAASLAPNRTVQSIQRDTQVLSERVSG